MISSTNNSMEEANQRNWRITSENSEGADFNIILKIRGETADNFVPEKLYCSHKYHVIMNIRFPDRLIGNLPKVVVCKIRIVMSKGGEVVRKKGNPIVKGIVTTGLQRVVKRGRKKSNYDSYGGSMRIQFCASSYHFKKAFFVMKLDFFDPDRTNEKILEISSPNIQTFSRKPTVGKMTLEPEASKPPLLRKKKKKKKKKKAPPINNKRSESGHRPVVKTTSSSSNNSIVPPPPPPQTKQSEVMDDIPDEIEEEEEVEEWEDDNPISTRKSRIMTRSQQSQQGQQKKEIFEDELKGLNDEQLYAKYLEQLEKVKNLKKNMSVEEELVVEDLTLQKLLEQNPPSPSNSLMTNNNSSPSTGFTPLTPPPPHTTSMVDTSRRRSPEPPSLGEDGDGFEIPQWDLDGFLDFSSELHNQNNNNVDDVDIEHI